MQLIERAGAECPAEAGISDRERDGCKIADELQHGRRLTRHRHHGPPNIERSRHLLGLFAARGQGGDQGDR